MQISSWQLCYHIMNSIRLQIKQHWTHCFFRIIKFGFIIYIYILKYIYYTYINIFTKLNKQHTRTSPRAWLHSTIIKINRKQPNERKWCFSTLIHAFKTIYKTKILNKRSVIVCRKYSNRLRGQILIKWWICFI